MIGRDATSPLAGKRILVIEDIQENMRLFRAILRLEQAVALEATSAAEGIEIAQSQNPDVILVDMQMPEMDGIEAISLLRANLQTQHIPIIVVTASAMSADRERAFAAGCNGYITKPIDPMNFAVTIAAHLK